MSCKGRRRGRRLLDSGNDRGAVAIIVAVFAIVAMILLAFVIDRGRVYIERTQLQNAADAAALAAVQATCQAASNNEAAARTVALQYLVENGFTPVDVGGVPDNYQIIVQDGPTSETTGVSVAVERPVPAVFGGFAGVETSNVAARATATRVCRAAFQYVADKDTNFNGGTPTIAGNIFAGKCFDGEGGSFPGIVGVATADTPEAKTANCGSFLPGSAVYAIWNDNDNASRNAKCPPGVGDCEYGVTGVSLATAIAAAGYNKSNLDALFASAPACSAVTQTAIDSGPVVCNGDLTFQNGWTIKYDVLATGDIKDRSNTPFCGTYNGSAAAPFVAGKVLVYSRSGRIDLQTNVTTGSCPRIPSNYVFYAPTSGSQPAIRYTGGGAQMDATFIGYDIVSNGQGASGGSGVQIRFAGPWRLSQ